MPTDWPEQEVKVVTEDISPEVRLHYETLEHAVKIMSFKIAQIAPGQEVKALVTFEVRRSAILPPDDTSKYVLADPKKLPREIRPFLLPSPRIETRDPKIREAAKKVGVDKEKAWEHVEAIYDWVWEHIKDQDCPVKGAAAAIRDGTGNCEERSSLFIAICRAAGIPARTVWVPGHCLFGVLSGRRQRPGALVPLPIARRPAVRRHYRLAADLSEGRQHSAASQRRQRTPAFPGRIVDRHAHARRRTTAGQVHPRGGAELNRRSGAAAGLPSNL